VLAESIIGDSGYRTLSAASGREALVLLEQGVAVALLFTDINLGVEPDGIELARRVIEAHPGFAGDLPRDQLLSALTQQISGSQQTDSSPELVEPRPS
jgi:CheY-like chemotaxis protein